MARMRLHSKQKELIFLRWGRNLLESFIFHKDLPFFITLLSYFHFFFQDLSVCHSLFFSLSELERCCNKRVRVYTSVKGPPTPPIKQINGFFPCGRPPFLFLGALLMLWSDVCYSRERRGHASAKGSWQWWQKGSDRKREVNTE